MHSPDPRRPLRPPAPHTGWFILFFALAIIGSVAWPLAARATPTYVTQLDAAHVGVYDVDAVGDTDWHTLSSSDFADLVAADGTALPSGLVVVKVMVVNQSANVWHFKVREAAGVGDATTNRLRALGNGTTTLPVRGLVHRSSVGTYATAGEPPKAVSFKLGHAADTGQIVVYFGKP